ncbi:MAG: LuxR C-terminal-related transcriptional regulator [Bacteroidota bacterium]
MQAPGVLIHTKLRVPSSRASLVSRPRLREQILQGLRCPLTLVVAPAGFGKTTLVASVLAGPGIPVAWLSLDKDDNEPGRFLSYMAAALHEADASIGMEAARLIASSEQVPAQAVLVSLINDMDSNGGEDVLVLDDYQFVTDQAVHEQVAFMLEHCPATFHAVIVSRSDPPLPVARLRACGQAVELRAEDLSFREAEAALFLNEVMGLRLDAGSVRALKERTEGWIAGLQMAALSMRHQEDAARFIAAFSGTNRYILDYLLEEVLAGQPPEIQRFLLSTSILERLSAPLCDALLDGDGAAGPSHLEHSASILDYLERANLFLLPLDEERSWYRYHHLFADLLRAELQKEVGAAGVAGLHLRAAAWHEQNDSVLDAIHHASLASDDERVERLIEQSYLEMVRRGEMDGLRFWSGRLNRDLVYRRPWLCIYEAYSHSWFGELDEADYMLQAAENRLQTEPATADVNAMRGQLTYVRSRVAAMRGDLPQAIEFNLAAREYLPISNVALQLDMGITLGYLYFLKGDYSEARRYLNGTVRSGKAVGAILNTVAGYCILARLYANEGRLKESYELYRQAAQWIEEIGGQHLGASSLVEIGFAEILCEWNDLDGALAHIKRGLASIHLWGKADDLILACVTASRIHLARADERAAQDAICKALLALQTRGVFPEAPGSAALGQVKSWLALGDLPAASRWAASFQESAVQGDPYRYVNEPAQIARARVLIARQEADEALEVLSRLEERARSAGRTGRLIEILILRALALAKGDEIEAAVRVLGEGLALAEPGGYVRLFIDEGQPMHLLLGRWLGQARRGPLRDYAAGLFAAGNAAPTSASTRVEVASPGDLVAPLSRRELEVLRLMAVGSTNQEIARQLVVAEGTVKAHTASIYRKLEASNRTEAVSRARQIGLLP